MVVTAPGYLLCRLTVLIHKATQIVSAAFYGLTAQSAIVYYRRRVFSNVWDGLLVGILPFCTTGFLAWMIEQTLSRYPLRRYGRWSAS
jgi:hypothetical protein